MMSPENERMRLLDVAIDRASSELRKPVDRVEVTKDYVTCWSGNRQVVMEYGYAQGGNIDDSSGRFLPAPGSGNWYVVVVSEPAPKAHGRLAKVIAMLLGRASSRSV